MLTTIAYYVVLITSFAYLAKYGGKTGLWGGILMFSTSLLALLIALTLHGSPYAIRLMTILDFLLAAGLIVLALKSTRYWPIWCAGFQVNIVAAHVSIWFLPQWKGELYHAMITVWAIPSLLVMLIGTALDHRKKT